MIQIWTKNLILNLNENIWNFIENGQKQLDFWLILTFLIEMDHLQLNNQHKNDNFWSLNQKWLKMDAFNPKQIEIDRIYIKIKIVDTISSLKSESDQNRRSNLAGLESESSTIQFERPNRISLLHTIVVSCNW